MESARLIANPYHLRCEKEDTTEKNNISLKKITLVDYLNDNYEDIYLSNHNIKCMFNL